MIKPWFSDLLWDGSLIALIIDIKYDKIAGIQFGTRIE